MASNRRRYLVAYDIRHPKRLRHVHGTVKGFGWAMQYSVFICDLDEIELFELKFLLFEIIDQRVDSIAVIDVGLPSERGRSCFEFIGASPDLPAAGPTII